MEWHNWTFDFLRIVLVDSSQSKWHDMGVEHQYPDMAPTTFTEAQWADMIASAPAFIIEMNADLDMFIDWATDQLQIENVSDILDDDKRWDEMVKVWEETDENGF